MKPALHSGTQTQSPATLFSVHTVNKYTWFTPRLTPISTKEGISFTCFFALSFNPFPFNFYLFLLAVYNPVSFPFSTTWMKHSTISLFHPLRLPTFLCSWWNFKIINGMSIEACTLPSLFTCSVSLLALALFKILPYVLTKMTGWGMTGLHPQFSRLASLHILPLFILHQPYYYSWGCEMK